MAIVIVSVAFLPMQAMASHRLSARKPLTIVSHRLKHLSRFTAFAH